MIRDGSDSGGWRADAAQHVAFTGRFAFVTSGDDGTLRTHNARTVGSQRMPRSHVDWRSSPTPLSRRLALFRGSSSHDACRIPSCEGLARRVSTPMQAAKASEEKERSTGTALRPLSSITSMVALRVVTGALAATAALLLPATAGAALEAPAPLSPAANASVQALPAFAWDAVAGASKYEFALAADAGFNAPVLGLGEGQFFTRNTRATVKKTLPNGTYWWRVRAIAASGAVSPWAAPRPLRKAWTTAPTLLSPTLGAVASHPLTPLVLKWSAVPHAAKYWVTVASDPALGSAVLGQGNVETAGTSYAPRACCCRPARTTGA